MNADASRWIGQVALSVLCSLTATTQLATAEEFNYSLANEIEHKFPEPDAAVDDAGILESALLFTQTFQASKEGMLGPGVQMDHPPLPWRPPTFVEMVIEEGYFSDRGTKPLVRRDDSYLLAERDFTFGGMKFSR